MNLLDLCVRLKKPYKQTTLITVWYSVIATVYCGVGYSSVCMIKYFWLLWLCFCVSYWRFFSYQITVFSLWLSCILCFNFFFVLLQLCSVLFLSHSGTLGWLCVCIFATFYYTQPINLIFFLNIIYSHSFVTTAGHNLQLRTHWHVNQPKMKLPVLSLITCCNYINHLLSLVLQMTTVQQPVAWTWWTVWPTWSRGCRCRRMKSSCWRWLWPTFSRGSTSLRNTRQLLLLQAGRCRLLKVSSLLAYPRPY